VLSPDTINSLAQFAHSLGLEVLMEVHDKEELVNNLHDSVDIIGVNNRNLKTFEVNVETSIDLSPIIPERYIKISESGIDDPKTIIKLRQHGFQGFLMGEHFMRHNRPEKKCAEFIEALKRLQGKDQLEVK
jgi:indole-3-glycerol phosphate synthase